MPWAGGQGQPQPTRAVVFEASAPSSYGSYRGSTTKEFLGNLGTGALDGTRRQLSSRSFVQSLATNLQQVELGFDAILPKGSNVVPFG